MAPEEKAPFFLAEPVARPVLVPQRPLDTELVALQPIDLSEQTGVTTLQPGETFKCAGWQAESLISLGAARARAPGLDT